MTRGHDRGMLQRGPAVPVPSAALVQQFEAAPPGKLYCLHGSSGVFRMSLAAASHVLLKNIPVTLVDGTNRFDVYYIAEFARRVAQQQGGEQACAGPEALLKNIFVSRAFTCYQMEAVITERLPSFVRSKGSPVAIAVGLATVSRTRPGSLALTAIRAPRAAPSRRTLRSRARAAS